MPKFESVGMLTKNFNTISEVLSELWCKETEGVIYFAKILQSNKCRSNYVFFPSIIRITLTFYITEV